MAYFLIDGQVVLIDDDDHFYLSRFRWRINPQGYAVTTTHPTTMMSRMIMKVTDRTQKVDHENWDTLDNRKNNLRVLTHSQNVRHQQHASRITTRTRADGSIAYRATVCFEGKNIALGTFRTERRAEIVAAYNTKRLMLGLPIIALKRKMGKHKYNPIMRVLY